MNYLGITFCDVQNSILLNPDLLHCTATQEQFAFYDKVIAAYESGLMTKQVAESIGCSEGTAGSTKRFLRKAKEGSLTENDNKNNQSMFAWAILRASKENKASAVNDLQATCEELNAKLNNIKRILLERADRLRILKEFVNCEFDITPLFQCDIDDIAKVNHHYDEILEVLCILGIEINETGGRRNDLP